MDKPKLTGDITKPHLRKKYTCTPIKVDAKQVSMKDLLGKPVRYKP